MIKKLALLVIFTITITSCSIFSDLTDNIFSVFTDPGGNKKYEIDIPKLLDESKPTESDKEYFNKNIFPNVLNNIVLYSYYPSEYALPIKDSILDYRLNYILTNAEKTKELYFVSVLIQSETEKNNRKYTHKKLLQNAIFANKADSKYNLLKVGGINAVIITDNRTSIQQIESNNYFSEQIVKHVIVDYQYSADKRLKKLNPDFWVNIENYLVPNTH